MYRLAAGLTQLPVQWVVGAYSPRLNRPGHEADDSYSVPRLRMSEAMPPLPSVCFHDVYRDKFAMQFFFSAI
jgi:hypothetical protein